MEYINKRGNKVVIEGYYREYPGGKPYDTYAICELVCGQLRRRSGHGPYKYVEAELARRAKRYGWKQVKTNG